MPPGAESAAQCARLEFIGELDERRAVDLAETTFWRTDPYEQVAAEISAALVISAVKAGIWANVNALDGAAFDQRLDALSATVCEHDPRTTEQQRQHQQRLTDNGSPPPF